MLRAWRDIAAIDGHCLHAHVELAVAAAATALASYDAQVSATAAATVESCRLATMVSCRGATVEIGRALACCDAHEHDPPARWAALGGGYVRMLRAVLELHLAVLLDFCSEAPDARSRAREHYSRAATADEEGVAHDVRLWQLWASCAERDETLEEGERRAAAAAVHRRAWAHGVYVHADQRPLQLDRRLTEHAVSTQGLRFSRSPRSS
jgi:hypothetical protein